MLRCFFRERVEERIMITGSGTAFYWTSTMAPTPPTGTGRDNQAAWSIELNYSGPGHVYTMTTYGYSIRCVKDEVIYVR